ncbi:hypothetical protein EI981_05980 [Paenibacillus lutimineralis]|uniref:Uncharacterized protein n=1 Tax=Paenibacillus lutimineralis TaxID=2707005 RepID=A0A3S9UVH1_9BACL|nr:hypothetical protein EI981_05980 [Paenibacillus lutimineralis]
MKYLSTWILLVCIVLATVGCNLNEDTNTNLASQEIHNKIQEENEVQNLQQFHLGMTIDKVREVLEANDIEIINEIENTGDSDAWDWGNKSIWTEGISFTFDHDYILYELEYENDEATELGVKAGDKIDLLKEVYGNNYKLYSYDQLVDLGVVISKDLTAEIYEYQMEDHYFRVFVIDSKITSWGISKYKLGTNSPITEDYSQVALHKQDNPVKKKLWEEFQHYRELIHADNNSKYTQILASDRARGLLTLDKLGFFKLSEYEFNQVNKSREELRSVLEHSVVYSGYSSNNEHIIAIISPQSYESESYQEAINLVANQDDEYEFLSYITEQSDERSLLVGLDLKIESTSVQTDEMNIEKIIVSNPDDSNSDTAYFAEELTDVIAKYKRTKMVNNSLKSGEWYALAYDGTLIYDPVITVFLNGEQVVLSRQ